MFVFVPAISEQILNNLFAGKSDLNWWCKKAPFQHPAGLLSSYYVYNRTNDYYKDYKKQNFREIIQFPKSSLFVLDSGGFEIYSPKSRNNKYHDELIKILTPKKVLEIEEAIADVGIILDIPPFLDGAHNTNSAFFQEAMHRTSENTMIMLANRSPASKLKLYGVVQGKNSYQLSKWWETMRVFRDKVDGWALAAKGGIHVIVTYIVFILLNKINVPVHFLGVGNPNALALIIYLMRKDRNGMPYFPHLISADSSSYNAGAMYGKTFGKKPSMCDCSLTNLHDLYASSIIDSGMALSLHNLYHLQCLIKTLTFLIQKDPKRYIEYVLSRSGKKSAQMSACFKLIDSIIAEKRTESVSSSIL